MISMTTWIMVCTSNMVSGVEVLFNDVISNVATSEDLVVPVAPGKRSQPGVNSLAIQFCC